MLKFKAVQNCPSLFLADWKIEYKREPGAQGHIATTASDNVEVSERIDENVSLFRAVAM
ncbi:MAG: hypothetical protein AAF364_16695 [Pseudomonadota bacterium]